MNKYEYFKTNYNPYMIKWGRITNCIGIVVGFLPVICMKLFFGLTPNWTAVGIGLLGIVAAIGVSMVVDPIATVPVVGAPGTMMGFFSGNMHNLRIPCAAIAQDVAETEPGSPESEIMSILGMSVSVVINIIILAICAIGGVKLLGVIPESASSALNYMLPAVFGAVFMQFALKQPKIIPFCLGLALVMRIGVAVGIFPAIVNSFVTFAVVLFSMFIGVMLYRRKNAKK